MGFLKVCNVRCYNISSVQLALTVELVVLRVSSASLLVLSAFLASVFGGIDLSIDCFLGTLRKVFFILALEDWLLVPNEHKSPIDGTHGAGRFGYNTVAEMSLSLKLPLES